MRVWDSAEGRLDIGQGGDGGRAGRGREGWGPGPEHLAPQRYRTQDEEPAQERGWGGGGSGREGGGTWLMASGWPIAKCLRGALGYLCCTLGRWPPTGGGGRGTCWRPSHEQDQWRGGTTGHAADDAERLGSRARAESRTKMGEAAGEGETYPRWEDPQRPWVWTRMPPKRR